jgi:hypothetical protein
MLTTIEATARRGAEIVKQTRLQPVRQPRVWPYRYPRFNPDFVLVIRRGRSERVS